ncbi:MAG: hypothetical protein U0793_19745 [Gemmataceae bacterium]
MAKGKKNPATEPVATAPSGQPICVACVACDRVIQGNDSTVSLIRVIDTITLPKEDKRDNETMIEIGDVTMVTLLKRGDALGEHKLALLAVDPSGKKTPIGMFTFSVSPDSGAESGVNVLNRFRVLWGGYGLYWIELVMGDATNTVLARTPIKLIAPPEPAKGNSDATPNSSQRKRHRK